ncbi:sulfotransferase domain-containing protein [Roseovarius sp. EL26]|uniref:sulfotransferase domain-containing protein n=1 Tax=Roseovarius sp. EL26 TaxID=2126672 RepID=UPI0013C4F7A1|nr:sulfotransferase domain-containing protein [Roseovarius sp. EL26]
MTRARPTDMDGVRQNLKGFATETGVQQGLSYQPAASDIFISPFAKCGTTWMQQIVHGLRTGGAMEFDEITEVVPWLELAHDMGMDVDAPQVAHPRAFKSHLSWDEIPKGGRYIVVLRDPVDAMVSLYKFFDGWQFEAGSITLEDFAAYFLERDPSNSYWHHAQSWWAQRAHADVLLLAFEEMKLDLPAAVRQVAAFMGVSDPKVIELATHQAGFAFMKAHSDQFDDHLLRHARDAACNLPTDGVSTKVNQGQAGQGKHMISDHIRAAFADRWHGTMGQSFGLADYAALRQVLKTP